MQTNREIRKLQSNLTCAVPIAAFQPKSEQFAYMQIQSPSSTSSSLFLYFSVDKQQLGFEQRNERKNKTHNAPVWRRVRPLYVRFVRAPICAVASGVKWIIIISIYFCLVASAKWSRIIKQTARLLSKSDSSVQPLVYLNINTVGQRVSPNWLRPCCVLNSGADLLHQNHWPAISLQISGKLLPYQDSWIDKLCALLHNCILFSLFVLACNQVAGGILWGHVLQLTTHDDAHFISSLFFATARERLGSAQNECFQRRVWGQRN